MLKCPDTWDEIVGMIFERQRFLMDQYKPIEQLPDPPVSLHTPHGQRIIRDFAWRVTEELTESHEAFIKHQDAMLAKCAGLEELADAVHFLVELLIFSGVSAAACLNKTPSYKYRNGTSITGAYWDVVYKMGLAMNYLKNKSWKRTHILTDEAKFRAAILEAWASMVKCWSILGCEQEEIFNYYFAKSAIIDQRLRENY